MGDKKYDIFLSYCSEDKIIVEAIAHKLRKANVTLFFDQWSLIPGQPWQEALEIALRESRTIAIFIGPKGFGPWHNEEMRIAVNTAVGSQQNSCVIPIILPGSKVIEHDELPSFLARVTWVDFRGGIEDDNAYHRLLCGIQGISPSESKRFVIKQSSEKITRHNIKDIDNQRSRVLRIFPK